MDKKITFTLFLLIASLVLFSGCQDSYYLKDGIVYCNGAEPGQSKNIEGRNYYVVDDNTIDYAIRNKRWICTSHVTNMEGLFKTDESRNYLREIDITRWDVSNVENMHKMFKWAERFNQDIGNWRTGNVKDMSYMFRGAGRFNQDIGGWDTSNVVDMNHMFCGAGRFNQDIGGWDTSNVVDMSNMFCDTKAFNQDISNWDTGNVENMEGIFQDAESFNQDISQWDTGNVKDMSCMFCGAEEFDKDISELNTSNVENMEDMFKEKTEKELKNGYSEKINDLDYGYEKDYEPDKFKQSLDINYSKSIYNIKELTISIYKEFEGITVDMDEHDYFNYVLNETTNKFDLEIDSETGIIRAKYPNIGCVNISPGSRFEFVGEAYDDFALFVPSYGDVYELCIRTLEKEDYDSDCNNCGVIDFINKTAEFNGIYQYEKTSSQNHRLFRNMINSKGNYSLTANNHMFNNTNMTFYSGQGITTLSYFDIAQSEEETCLYTSHTKENNYIFQNYINRELKGENKLKGTMQKLFVKDVFVHAPGQLDYLEDYADGII